MEYEHFIEADDFSFVIYIDYNVAGQNIPATRNSPPEYCEVEIESIRIPKELAEILECNEYLDFDKIKKYLELDKLTADILDDYEFNKASLY